MEVRKRTESITVLNVKKSQKGFTKITEYHVQLNRRDLMINHKPTATIALTGGVTYEQIRQRHYKRLHYRRHNWNYDDVGINRMGGVYAMKVHDTFIVTSLKGSYCVFLTLDMARMLEEQKPSQSANRPFKMHEGKPIDLYFKKVRGTK